MCCMIHIQKPVYYRKFRHFQAYSCPIQTYIVAYLEPCVTVSYSEYWHIQNLIYIQNSVKQGIWHMRNGVKRLHIENPASFSTLSNSEFWHIQYFGIFRILFNQEHSDIQAYSIMIVIIKKQYINFLFFTLIIHAFQPNLKRHMF